MLFWRVRDALKQQANSKVRKKKKTDEQQEEVRGLSLKYDLTKGVGLCGNRPCVGCTRQFFTKSFRGDDSRAGSVER